MRSIIITCGARAVYKIAYTVVYTGFCVWGGGPGSNGPVFGGTFFIVEIKNSRFFKLEIFQKMILKINEKFIIFENFKGILRFFENFIEIFAKIMGNI